jgi:hypothetical protein
MNPTSTPSPRVTGYLAETWSDEAIDALIVNPQARAVDLLAWCCGELQSMRAAVSFIHSSRGDIDRDDFSALMFHRMEPMAAVMSLVMTQLLAEAGKPQASGQAATGA